MSDCTAALGAIEQRIRETSNSLLRAEIAQASKALSDLCTGSGAILTAVMSPEHKHALTALAVLDELNYILYTHYREARETRAINSFMAQVSQVSGLQTPSTKETK